MSKRWGETLIFASFVIVAAALWYGHAMTSVRTEVVPVHVQYTGIDSHIAFEDSLPEIIAVEIRDAGQRLKTYFRDRPTITINLHSQIEDNNGSINVTEEQLRMSINSVLQGTSKLLSVNPATLHTTYYRQVDKQVHVILRTKITPAEEYQIALEPELLIPTTQVYGDPKILQGIDTIYTQMYTFTDLMDTLTDWVSLELPKGVRAHEEKVAFTVVTERFTEKVFTLPITYVSPDSSLTLRLFPAEAAVTVRCAIHDFNKVKASDITLTCNFPTAGEERLTIFATTKNPEIAMLRVNPSQVEYIVEQQ